MLTVPGLVVTGLAVTGLSVTGLSVTGLSVSRLGAGAAVLQGGGLFSANYLPHRFCYLAQPGLIWTNVAMDGLIAASYAAIFVCLMWTSVRLSRMREFRAYLWIFLSFGMFILACGMTHVMEMVTVWWPVYPLSAGVKVLCAAASVPTAILFARATPALARHLGQFLEMASATERERDQAIFALGHWEKVVEERQAAANQLAIAYAQLNTALECTNDMVMTLGFEWTMVYGNGKTVASLPDFAVGGDYWSSFPSVVGTVVEEKLRTAMEQRVETGYEIFYEPYGRWYRARAFPSSDGISVFFTDTTEERELREQLELEQQLREKRIEALSHMAGGLAHEISNPLAIIHARASDLKAAAAKAAAAKLAAVAAGAAAARAALSTNAEAAKAALTLQATAARGALAREVTAALAALAAEAGAAEAALGRAANVAERTAGAPDATAVREALALGSVAAKAGLAAQAATAREALAQKVTAALEALAKEASAAEIAIAEAASVAEVSLVAQATLAAEKAAQDAEAAAVSAGTVLEVCESIVNTSDRAIRILRGLRGFGREASQDPLEWASMHDILDQSVELQAARYERHGVALKVDVEGNLPLLLCRETQIGQIVTNLLNNAFDAIEQGGCTERWVLAAAKSCAGEICLDVTDSGPGVPEEFRAHLMEAFFTTKKMGLGMGVGLSLSRAIAQDHGGSLDLLSTTEHTCFRLRLPIGSEEVRR